MFLFYGPFLKYTHYTNKRIRQLVINANGASQHVFCALMITVTDLYQAGATAAHTTTQTKTGDGQLVRDQRHEAIILVGVGLYLGNVALIGYFKQDDVFCCWHLKRKYQKKYLFYRFRLNNIT